MCKALPTRQGFSPVWEQVAEKADAARTRCSLYKMQLVPDAACTRCSRDAQRAQECTCLASPSCTRCSLTVMPTSQMRALRRICAGAVIGALSTGRCTDKLRNARIFSAAPSRASHHHIPYTTCWDSAATESSKAKQACSFNQLVSSFCRFL